MATLDRLPAEQRAIIELVVQSGRSYDDLADMLGMDASRVRELAREALTELAPLSAGRVDPDRRGQIVDYVLGQQSSAEETATKAHLRRSESGRAWTSSLVDSLADMYDGRAPEIPEAEAEAPPRRRERERDRPRERERTRERTRDREPSARAEREPLRRPREDRPAREPRRRPALSPEAQAAVRRRRIVGGLLGLLAIAGIVLGIVLLTGGDDDDGGDDNRARRDNSAQPRILGELLLRPVDGGSEENQGIAIVADRGGERTLIVQAKLPPTKDGQAYGVWLYNDQGDAVSVGAQVTDQQGNYQGAGRLPADLTRYKSIDVSLQAIPDEQCQRDRACLERAMQHSGDSILRGDVADLRPPSQTGAGGQQAPGGPPPPGGQQAPPGQQVPGAP